MTMTSSMRGSDLEVRRLVPNDLAKVTEIDGRLSGSSRRGYFEKRLAAALREPNSHIQLGIDGSSGLEAYILARILEGEYGDDRRRVLLEVIGVDPAGQHAGMGNRLITALEIEMQSREIVCLQTQAAWTDHDLLRFFDAVGFRKAPRHIIERPTEGLDLFERDELEDADEFAVDTATLARDRVEVSSMSYDDFDDLVRLDRKITGHDRRSYMKRKFDEAMLDSGIRVSLTARLDGIVAGFVMARIDFGDFGRSMPVAVIDTVAVSPDYRREGVALALLSQLAINLRALHVDTIETSVAVGNMDFMAFCYRCGFLPSDRIAFERTV